MTGERTVVELVQRLTGDWQSFEGGTLRTEGPLIGLLRSRMRSSMGMTHGGHSLPNERAALNLAAFQTYEFIKETAAQMFSEVLDGEPDRRFPEANLIAWRDEWDLADRRGEIIGAQRTRARRRLQGLVTRIDVLFDPPKVYEIAGACPNPECGERYWYTTRPWALARRPCSRRSSRAHRWSPAATGAPPPGRARPSSLSCTELSPEGTRPHDDRTCQAPGAVEVKSVWFAEPHRPPHPVLIGDTHVTHETTDGARRSEVPVEAPPVAGGPERGDSAGRVEGDPLLVRKPGVHEVRAGGGRSCPVTRRGGTNHGSA